MKLPTDEEITNADNISAAMATDTSIPMEVQRNECCRKRAHDAINVAYEIIHALGPNPSDAEVEAVMFGAMLANITIGIEMGLIIAEQREKVVLQ